MPAMAAGAGLRPAAARSFGSARPGTRCRRHKPDPTVAHDTGQAEPADAIHAGRAVLEYAGTVRRSTATRAWSGCGTGVRGHRAAHGPTPSTRGAARRMSDIETATRLSTGPARRTPTLCRSTRPNGLGPCGT